jgi:hypothetical protein
VLWIGWPGFPAFAAGFVLWGLGGSLVSGTLEALLYDGLAAVAAQASYAQVLGRVRAVGMLAQLPAALAATVLFSAGGYLLVGWASVGTCLAAAALALLLPEPPRAVAEGDDEGYLATLRAGLTEAAARPVVRRTVVAVAMLASLDALEEYFALLAQDWGVPTGLNPLVLLGIPMIGAAGALLAGRAGRLGAGDLTALLGAAGLALGGTGLLRQPIGLVAVALYYGVYRLVLVVAETRLQQIVTGPARATVTSVAGLGTDLATFGVYAAWALGGVVPVAVLLVLIAVTLPSLLRPLVENIPELANTPRVGEAHDVSAYDGQQRPGVSEAERCRHRLPPREHIDIEQAGEELG